MKPHRDAQVAGRAFDARLARRLLRYLVPYRWVVGLSVILLLVVSALQLAGPWLIQVAIDTSIRRHDPAGLTRLALLYLGLLLARFFLSFVQTYLMNWTGQKIMFDLRSSIFSHLQSLHLSYFEEHPTGRILTRLTSDVEVLNELFTAGVVSIFGDIFALAGIILIMLWMDWQLALLSFSVIPLLVLATWLFKNRVRGAYRRVRAAVARINSFLQENITGMSVVQIFVQEKRKFREFEERNRDHLEAHLRSIFYYAVFYPVVNLLGVLALALILWYGGGQIVEGTMTLGVLVAFIQYSERFYKPISDLSEKFNILQSALASGERIFQLLDTRPRLEFPEPGIPRMRAAGEIEFVDVHFRYRPDVPVLQGINLKVAAGEKVAIVGATGSGKSTLVRLLCRFYDVERGEILLDGVPLPGWDREALSRAMAVVLQDIFLFQGSVRDNISLWGRDFPQREIEEAAEAVHAHMFIRSLEHGYATRLGERGRGLSTGQRQLLAFARALVRDPQILVLDEATSSVDTQTELLIRDALDRLMRDRTCLIVAHRLSTIRNCDRIVVMHRGTLVEEGTHRELLRLGGIYAKLHQLQYREQTLQDVPLASQDSAGEAGGIL